MKRTLAILLILLVSAVVAAAQVSGAWITYASAEGRYSVSMPQPPTLSTKISTAESGENLLQYRAISMDGNAGFLVAYYDYERDMTFSLKKARDSIVASLHATVLEENQISLGGSAGKQLKFLAKVDPGGEFVDRVRLYDVHRRIYILQCILPKAADSPEGINRCEKFFDSFKVQSGH
jgi:hypothetical protein